MTRVTVICVEVTEVTVAVSVSIPLGEINITVGTGGDRKFVPIICMPLTVVPRFPSVLPATRETVGTDVVGVTVVGAVVTFVVGMVVLTDVVTDVFGVIVGIVVGSGTPTPVFLE
jgi:hypothetical protein